MLIAALKRPVKRLGLGLAVILAACFAAEVRLLGPGAPPGGGGDGSGNSGPTLIITPPTGVLAINATLQLTVTLRDQQGGLLQPGPVTWATSNPSVLTVNQTGLIRGVGLGSVVITATTLGVGATTTFAVVATPVAAVAITPSSATLQLGTTALFAAVVRDASGGILNGRAVTWSTSNAAILTVDATGLAHAVGVGSATLTATSEGQSGAAAVSIQNIPVASVQVTPAADTVQIGQQTLFVATPRDAAGGALLGRVVTWASSAPAVARTSGNGLVDGLAAGTATVSATSEGRSGSASVVVIPVPVATVVIVPQSVTVQVGGTTTFNATPRDANGNALTGRVTTWSSANPAIAQVSQTGVVSGVALGSVLVSATVEGVVGSAFITVTPIAAALVRVTILPGSASLTSGQSQQFALQGTLSDSSVVPVSGTFQTTGGTVNGAGIYVAPDLAGTFLVIGTATGTSLRDTAFVTVTRPPVATVQVTPATATVDVGRTRGLSATLRDALGNVLTNRIVTWSSNNLPVATVSSAGVVTAVAVGNATITATSEGQSGTAAITTRLTPVATVTVTPSAASVAPGLTTQLLATTRDANGNVLTGRVVTWTTNAPAVAVVNGTGLVTGQAVGSATITATSEGRTGSAAITVPIVGVASVTVTPSSLTRAVGQSGQFTATPRDAGGSPLTGQPITWASSNTAVATVSASGLVTALQVGQVTISATSGSVNGTAQFTAGTSLYANEPNGASVLLDWDFDLGSVRATYPETPTQPFFYATGLGCLATVTDNSAPVTPSRIGRITFSPTCVGVTGTGPAHVASVQRLVVPSNWSQWYMAYWWKYSSNFVVFPYDLKQVDLFVASNATYIVGTYGDRPPWVARHRGAYGNEGGSDIHAHGSIPLQADTWYQYEILVTKLPGGQLRHQVFINGVLDLDDTWRITGGPPAQVSFAWVYGGIGGVPLTAMHMFMDRLHVSYR